MTDSDVTNGQAAADSVGTTANAPGGNGEGSGNLAQTTVTGSSAAEDSFFDPKSIADKPELLAAYKQMQGSYTKRMQAIKASDQKIQAYDRFTASPLETMQQLATQYGYRLVQAAENQKPEDWNPQSWDDVMSEAEKRVLKKMQPVYSELRELKKHNVETYLDSEYPDWRTYEQDMMGKLQAHPSLVSDPDALYRISVPPEVWEARATKAAMAKLKASTDNAAVSGASRTSKQVTQEPGGPLSFDQAVQVARQRLAQQGIKAPAG